MAVKFAEEFKTYIERINPSKEADAMADYREERRTTPTGALIEITRLKQTEDLTNHQIRLLSDLENYLCTKFKNQSTDRHKQTQI